MNAPRKPRYAGVREQLDELEADIRTFLERAFIYEVNHAFWDTTGMQSPHTVEEIAAAIEESFDFIIRRWESIRDVRVALETARDVFTNTVLLCIDVSRPHGLGRAYEFLERVLTNMVNTLFGRQYRPRIENVMIQHQHHIEVIQRNWRKCSSDPAHLACRRRLEYEFESLSTDLERLHAV
jgi:hypothetical protein